MFNRVLLSLLLALVLALPAAAQDYQVRANRGLNLREGSSLDSRVVDTVRSGAILQVVGSFNRWLKIERNGRTVWLADWTDFSRVSGASPAAQPAQPAQPIDNCCFVDRQCASTDDWTDGYWAFQRGQCPAPQQPASSQPAAPVSISPQPASGRPQPLRPESVIAQLPYSVTDWSRVGAPGVDNCCQVGWDCQNDTEWLRGFEVYQASQCHHNAVNIEGSPAFVAVFRDAFERLRVHAPHWYSYTIAGLHGIKELPNHSGGGVHPHTRTYVQECCGHALGENDVYAFMGNMVHEACHLHMWNRGLAVASWTNELPCVESQLYATEAADPLDRQSRWLRDLIANMHDPSRWWW